MRGAPLLGKLRDETGDLLPPTHTQRHGRRIRSYISTRLVSGGPDDTSWRLPAKTLEVAVARAITRHLSNASQRHALLTSGTIAETEAAADKVAAIAQAIESEGIARVAGWIQVIHLIREAMTISLSQDALSSELGIPAANLNSDLRTYETPLSLRRRGVEAKLIVGDRTPEPDKTLLRALRKAHHWADLQKAGSALKEIAKRDKVSESYIRRITLLATLSPALQSAIASGTQPVDLTLETLVHCQIPMRFADQERVFRLSQTLFPDRPATVPVCGKKNFLFPSLGKLALNH